MDVYAAVLLAFALLALVVSLAVLSVAASRREAQTARLLADATTKLVALADVIAMEKLVATRVAELPPLGHEAAPLRRRTASQADISDVFGNPSRWERVPPPDATT